LTWHPIITFSVVFIIFFIVSSLRLDPDFGWHLKAGEYFLAHSIPATDIFTYTATNFPWVDHEWLSDTLMSIIYSGGGYLALCAVYSAIWAFTVWLFGRKAHNLTILLAVLAIVPFAGVRAITWSALGLALLMVIVNAKDHRYRWLILPLFLIWANMHGSFVIGFVYLLYVVFKNRSWKFLTPTFIGILLTLFNPYGIGLYTEIFRTITDSSLRWRITEWQALAIPWMTIPYVLLWMCGFMLTGFKKWRKYLGIDVLFFIAGLSSARSLMLFIVVSFGLTDERLRAVATTIPKNLDKPQRRFIAIFGIIIALSVVSTIVIDYWGTSLDKESSYPKNAVAYLQKNPCEGALFNHYNYGGYLIWKLPSQKVFIDGRMPSWELNGHKYMDEYLDIIDNKSIRQRKFKEHNIKCALVMKSDEKDNIVLDLQKQNWIVVAKDPDSLLLISPK